MNDVLITTALAVNIFLTPIAKDIIPVEQGTKTAPEIKTVDRVIEPGDSLSSIAIQAYGDGKYWIIIWNDNPWIENPYIIEAGQKLKIRINKPTKPEDLSSELSKRFESINLITYKIPVQPQVQYVSQYSGGPLTEAQIQFLGNCESGMTATRNSGNGYYGAFQFSQGTWNRMNTGYARADMAPLEIQVDAIQRLVSKSNLFGQFPGCSAKMRSMGLI